MSYIHTPHYDRGMDGHLSVSFTRIPSRILPQESIVVIRYDLLLRGISFFHQDDISQSSQIEIYIILKIL